MKTTKTKLNLFQQTFLGDLIEYTNTKGEYRYYEQSMLNKYKEFGEPKELKKAISTLVKEGHINKMVNKNQVNGRYSTIVIFKPN